MNEIRYRTLGGKYLAYIEGRRENILSDEVIHIRRKCKEVGSIKVSIIDGAIPTIIDMDHAEVILALSDSISKKIASSTRHWRRRER